MTRGRLSNTEKYAIQGMLHDKKSINEIAQNLGRTENTIQNYVERELDSIHNTIASIQASSMDKRVTKEEIEARPNAVIDEDRIRNSKSRDLYLKKGAAQTDDKPIVSISTPAASARGDYMHEKLKSKKVSSRFSKNALWNINEQRMENEQ